MHDFVRVAFNDFNSSTPRSLKVPCHLSDYESGRRWEMLLFTGTYRGVGGGVQPDWNIFAKESGPTGPQALIMPQVTSFLNAFNTGNALPVVHVGNSTWVCSRFGYCHDPRTTSGML